MKKNNNLSIIAIITTVLAVLGFFGGFINQKVAIGKEMATVSAKANKNEENVKMLLNRFMEKSDKQDAKMDKIMEHLIDLKSR